MHATIVPTKNIQKKSRVTRLINRAFPTPAYLQPPSAGVDVSDTTIKWLALEPLVHAQGYQVKTFGSQNIAEGIVTRGVITDMDALETALGEVKKQMGGITYVHVALPEEAVYVFNMLVPLGSGREQILGLIEFEFEARIPIPIAVAVYDYDIITHHGGDGMQEIGVTVFPRDITESYAEAFTRAGLVLASLEVEASSIGRAVSLGLPTDPVMLVVDIGRARTGFAIVERGIPIFTSTVEIGGDAITHAVEIALGVEGEDVQTFKNEQGLLATSEKNKNLDGLVASASALADEVVRHYNYWNTRGGEHNEQSTSIGRIVLVGGSANLRGLPELIASRVQSPVVVGGIWGRVCSFDDYIPPIDLKTSLEYATAVGLALRAL
jgi:type IV pilus assembly protein PilM